MKPDMSDQDLAFFISSTNGLVFVEELAAVALKAAKSSEASTGGRWRHNCPPLLYFCSR
jgi:hypothetical protein